MMHQERLDKYAQEHLFGADFDPFLVRATSMSVMLLTGRASGNIYHMDSLAFPDGELTGVAEARKKIPVPGNLHVVMTNPPFGTDIKIEDDDISISTGTVSPSPGLVTGHWRSRSDARQPGEW